MFFLYRWPPKFISGNLITLTDVLYIMATSPDTAESHKKNHRCHCSFPLIKRCANFVIIFLVISPAAIAYWRGTWWLMDIYFYPKNPHLSAWISTALGLGVACVVVFLQEQWRKLLKKCSFPLNAVMWRIFVYPLAFCVVSAWRGVWTILGLYVTERHATMYALATHCFGFVILVMTKTTSTIIFSPGFTLSDKCFVPAELSFPTQSLPVLEEAYFGRVILKVWNCFLTVLVIGIAGIGYWRGTWTLVDIFTLHGQENDRLKSTILSLAVGYSIVVGCFCICEIIQKKIDIPMSRLCYVVEMIFIYVLVFGVVNIWRAGFYIQDDFLLPGKLWWTSFVQSSRHVRRITSLNEHFTVRICQNPIILE